MTQQAGQPGEPGRPRDHSEHHEPVGSGGPRESAGSGGPRSGGPGESAGSGGPREHGASSRPREAAGTRPGGFDLAGEFQRWLVRMGARSMRRELTGQLGKTFGGQRNAREDVWGTATAEPPPGEPSEAPECAWCPVCRAARKIRESGPGLGGHLAGAGDAVAAAVQDALAAFDVALSARPGPRADAGGSSSGHPGADDGRADRAADRSGGPAREPDNRG